MTFVLLVVLAAIIFEFINGFHDTANSIATVVSTKVLTPRQAIVLAAFTNLLGALWGTAVAKTIASGLVDAKFVDSHVILSALLGAIVWNLITWRVGMPSSSSHALIGGLCGAVLAAAHNDFSAIIWSDLSGSHWYEHKGVLWKVVVPMISSPVCGFLIGALFMSLWYIVLHRVRPKLINDVFGKLQIFSAAGMGFMHGTNDAQKTMGIIALTLVAAHNDLVNLPETFSFLLLPAPLPGTSLEIPAWIKIMCAIIMAAGTSVGGWRIIKTLGHKMVKLQPIHGFAAETSSSVTIWIATLFGVPVSTTHVISSSILGVGAAKNLRAVKWSVVEQMAWSWVLTIPAAGGVAYLLTRVFSVVFGW